MNNIKFRLFCLLIELFWTVKRQTFLAAFEIQLFCGILIELYN